MGPHPAKKEEGGDAARPEFDRVTEVLGPLEQIVLAADQEIGSLQQRVDTEADEMSTRIDRRVREAALEQRERVIKMRSELTDAASRLATRFETMLDILDQAERQLAMQGLPEAEAAGLRITLTERRRVTFSHEGPAPGPAEIEKPTTEQTPTDQVPTEQPESTEPVSKPPPDISASATGAWIGKDAATEKRKGIRGWWRRVRGSSS
jgi:hypothetical protein